VLQYRLTGLEEVWSEIPITDGMITYKSIPSGQYQLELKVRYRNQVGEVLRYEFEKRYPFWQRWWFYAGLVAAAVLLAILIYRRRIQIIKRRNKEALEKQKIQTNLLESQLKALRSQMNPHFIFNSLNSIQDLVLKQDTYGSYDYISLFAKLVRNTLNYSEQDFIPIEDEVQFLETYLSLEKLRFKDDFEYSIEWEGSQELQVPSLLLQPFIENALLHGLLHKEGLKKLSVKFSFDENLTCEITDNGIGREKAAAIKERQGRHKSFALRAIQQRLEILNEQEGLAKSSYEIIDLKNGAEVTGTMVRISIPYRRDY